MNDGPSETRPRGAVATASASDTARSRANSESIDSADRAPATKQSRWRRGLHTSLRVRELALLPPLVLCVIVGSFVSSRFLTTDNLTTVLQQADTLAVLVIGESLILLIGKLDLSLQSTFGLAPLIGSWAVVGAASKGHYLSPWLGILIMLLVGAAVGSFNALLIVRYKMNTFIVTLAMLIILAGFQLVVTSGQTIYILPPQIAYLGSASWLGIPVSVYIAVFIFLIAAWFLRSHTLGRAIYAIGGNEKAARAAGINTQRIMFGVFVMGSVLAAIAGLLEEGQLASVSSNQGDNLIFTAFAAAVIGGISLDGGRGTLAGAMSGVLLLTVVVNVLTFAAVPAFWIQSVYGGVILLSLAIARVTTGEAQT